MKHFSRLLVLALLLSVLAIPLTAQDGAGEGGTIIIHNNEDPAWFSPLLNQEASSADLIGRFTPGLLGLDPFTASYLQNAPGAMATTWEFDETGTVLTVNMREDAYWSDGEQITADDYMYFVNAQRSGLLDSPYPAGYFVTLDDGTPGTGQLVDVVALDDFTIQLTFAEPDCTNLDNIPSTLVPSHVYEADFGEDYAAINEDPLYLPGVYWGAWMDPVVNPGESVSMVANQDYPDAELGYVSPGEWVRLNLPDDDVAMERFKAGELTLMDSIAAWEVPFFLDNPDYQMFEFTSRSWTYIGFNLGNPENPQNAYDEDGNYIEQDPHPILGDKKVRQALAYAVDIDTVIETYKGGLSVNLGAPTIPGYPDYDPDLVIPFDPDLSRQLLEEAGWVLNEGSEFRVCEGCMYAEDGTELALEFLTIQGLGEQFELYMEFMAQQWRDVGVNVEAQFVDYGTVISPATDSQTFDMYYLGWRLGLPADPDKIWLFGTEADVVDGGYNSGSYHNPELDQLFRDARNPALTDNCNMDVRAEMYKEANRILNDDMPYIFLWTNKGFTVTQGNVENWVPAEQFRMQNEDAWVIRED